LPILPRHDEDAGSVTLTVVKTGFALGRRWPRPGALADPSLELHDSNGNVIASNDDWQSDPVSAGQLAAHGLALPNSKESGLFVSLPPGAFTAILHGSYTNTGIGLAKIYNLK
jgi:hypothetical protein